MQNGQATEQSSDSKAVHYQLWLEDANGERGFYGIYTSLNRVMSALESAEEAKRRGPAIEIVDIAVVQI